MAKRRAPRRGSLQFWPRKRSKKKYARIRIWHGEENKVLGFAGYKVGMSHVGINGKAEAVTLIECPPLMVFGLRFYTKDAEKKPISTIYAKNLKKEIIKSLKIGKSGKEAENFDDVRILVYTQPKLIGISKKKPEIFEIGIGGGKDKKLDLGKSLLGKEIKVENVFEKGKLTDIHSITKGKGFQGTVKRFGVAIRQHKSEKTKRGVGNLGAWTPKRVSYELPQPGKMGYHLRTEYNKLILDINNEDINPKSGFKNYGKIKNDYILVKGSVGGSRKRLVIMTFPSRPNKKQGEANINYLAIKR